MTNEQSTSTVQENQAPDILVLMGGASLEHDVSIISGSGMVRQVPPSYSLVYPVYIDRQGQWYYSSQGLDSQSRQTFILDEFLEKVEFSAQSLPSIRDLPGQIDSRFALLGLHGAFGEDGKVQAYLELLDIPYSGSRVLGSALAMDKIKTKEIYHHHGILTPEWKVIQLNQWKSDITQAVEVLGFPMIIKDPAGGSSYNIIRAENIEQATAFIDSIRVQGTIQELLAEKCIVGKECSCGFMEGAPRFPPTEIRPNNTHKFFDFEAKYRGESVEVTPADYPQSWITEIQNLSHLAHKILSLDVYSRTDFLTDEKGRHWAIETNTLPGFTPTSLLPQQAAYVGWDYSELIDQVIQISLHRARV